MTDTFLSIRTGESDCPSLLAGDEQRATAGLERLQERINRADPEIGERFRDWLDPASGSAPARNFLAALFGNSPFLTESLLADLPFAAELFTQGPQASLADTREKLNSDVAEAAAASAFPARLMTVLRQARRRAALSIAVGDLLAVWPESEGVKHLSDFADLAVDLAATALVDRAARSGRLPVAEGGIRRSGWIILALGKHGGRELNYSSDIDLVILYDAERTGGSARDLHPVYVRLTQDLVKLMQERTADGYVCRMDLRLRPDPSSTPVALSVEAAETYYESMGQNWERAAFIKARPIAGDIEAGHAFLRRLQPFIWRRNLDFASIQDIHSIKRQIQSHRGGARIDLNGHNLKLGRGGIREIEFFAQTQQLIWGGREPALRVPDTISALKALEAAGRIDHETVEAMTRDYWFLRTAEHRIQMINDNQTHSLPDNPADRARLSGFLGYDQPADFDRELVAVLNDVAERYADLFEDQPSLSGPGNLVFTGTEPDPGTVATLQGLGFDDAEGAVAIIQRWHRGRYHATRSERARQLLTELMPMLIQKMSETPDPGEALRRLDRFLGQLPAGVQFFSLLCAHPELLDLIAEIMGTAPELAETLGRRPSLFDAVLDQSFFDPPEDRATLQDQLNEALAEARDVEDVLDIVRRFAHDHRFRLGVQILRHLLPSRASGPALADLAEAVIAALLPAVSDAFAERHGRVPGGGVAVLALGRLGSRQMSFASDLDLILIYDAPADAKQSDGPQPLGVGAYFTRLCQRLLTALTALTAEGRLYEVDMRLRPSGRKGPLATHLDSFRLYHAESAWTWERMALTRARIVAGPPDLAAAITETVRQTLTTPRDRTELMQEVADMRRRIAAEHGETAPWRVKYRAGGLIDIEFIAQALMLKHAPEEPRVLAANMREALDRLAEHGALPPEARDDLQQALDLWRGIQDFLRVTVGDDFDEAKAPAGLKSALAKTGGAVDFAALERDMTAAAGRTRAWFEKLIGSVDGEPPG